MTTLDFKKNKMKTVYKIYFTLLSKEENMAYVNTVTIRTPDFDSELEAQEFLHREIFERINIIPLGLTIAKKIIYIIL